MVLPGITSGITIGIGNTGGGIGNTVQVSRLHLPFSWGCIYISAVSTCICIWATSAFGLPAYVFQLHVPFYYIVPLDCQCLSICLSTACFFGLHVLCYYIVPFNCLSMWLHVIWLYVPFSAAFAFSRLHVPFGAVCAFSFSWAACALPFHCMWTVYAFLDCMCLGLLETFQSLLTCIIWQGRRGWF